MQTKINSYYEDSEHFLFIALGQYIRMRQVLLAKVYLTAVKQFCLTEVYFSLYKTLGQFRQLYRASFPVIYSLP